MLHQETCSVDRAGGKRLAFKGKQKEALRLGTEAYFRDEFEEAFDEFSQGIARIPPAVLDMCTGFTKKSEKDYNIGSANLVQNCFGNRSQAALELCRICAEQGNRSEVRRLARRAEQDACFVVPAGPPSRTRAPLVELVSPSDPHRGLSRARF